MTLICKIEVIELIDDMIREENESRRQSTTDTEKLIYASSAAKLTTLFLKILKLEETEIE